ncbi:MAG TPA: MoxR family ATPase [Verrucomicrobiae bacterium]|nr:MoxR family ATPase [Verrucomicrobiae bacterium]
MKPLPSETKAPAKVKILQAEIENWNDEKTAAEVIARVKLFHQRTLEELQKVIVGQKDILELILVGMLCRGHVLLEGVPGLGKTLLFKTLAQILDLKFQHVQFTPDLMPADILGTEIIQTDPNTQARTLKFLPGPIFSHFLLADEINRTSPKTQSALLQAMQDKEVTVGKNTYPLEEPFFVLATQNPIDQEGVYPLPEAQLDRFMFNLFIVYPTYDEEVEIAKRFTQAYGPKVSKVISQEDILNLQTLVRGMLISEAGLRYAVDIVTATRPGPKAPAFVRESVEWGAGPRATLNIVLAAKARALIKGRYCVASEDVRAVAMSVLRHRIKLNFSAEAENIKASDIIQKILDTVPANPNTKR